MKPIVPILFVLALAMSVGVAAADPGPNNPHRDMIVNVDCEGEAHDYDTLYTVGLSPWFDPAGSTVAPGPTRVEKEVNGQWIQIFALPSEHVPALYCEWTRGEDNYRGDVQFAPARPGN
ncbi:MAG: hypothetical protein ACK2UK_16280 [Candidatus Promineifilaceae bacterium]|jgi:hypothetical protein